MELICTEVVQAIKQIQFVYELQCHAEEMLLPDPNIPTPNS
jgi:hypothetical protein